MGFCSKELKKEFETDVVNEPSVFEPLKVYCILSDSVSPVLHASNFLTITLKVPITTAADDSLEYFFIVFLIK